MKFNFLKNFSAVVFYLIIFSFLHGCSSFNSSRSGSLVFRFNENSSLYLELSIKGDFNSTRTLSLAEGSSVVFEQIPVGSQIYAHVIAYDSADENSTALYEGRSETITIKSGENSLSISLKKNLSLRFRMRLKKLSLKALRIKTGKSLLTLRSQALQAVLALMVDP